MKEAIVELIVLTIAILIISLGSRFTESNIENYFISPEFKVQQNQLIAQIFRRADSDSDVTESTAQSANLRAVTAMVNTIKSRRWPVPWQTTDDAAITREVEKSLLTNVYGKLLSCLNSWNFALDDQIRTAQPLIEATSIRRFSKEDIGETDEGYDTNRKCHILYEIARDRAQLMSYTEESRLANQLRTFELINHKARAEAGMMFGTRLDGPPVVAQAMADFRGFMSRIDNVTPATRDQIIQMSEVGVNRVVDMEPATRTTLDELIHSIRFSVALTFGITIRLIVGCYQWRRRLQE